MTTYTRVIANRTLSGHLNTEAISFDFYGTIIDWLPVWVSVTTKIVGENNLSVHPKEFALEWRRAQWQFIEAKEFTPYKEMIGSALGFLCEKYRIENRGYHELLFSQWKHMLPFPEVPETLKKLKSRFPLAVCSNSSRDFFDICANKLPIRFDHILLSDETKVNKPHPRMYDIAAGALGVPKNLILHVASSQMDVQGATKAGLTVCWINRRNEERLPETPTPTVEIINLSEPVDILL